MNETLPKPESLTHQHIMAVVNALLVEKKSGVVRILDAGCGDGRLMSFLHSALALTNLDLKIEIYGFDVQDHGVQAGGFLDRTIMALNDKIPNVNWKDRIRTISIGDSWPFEDLGFDFIVSNQVMEHVLDKLSFLKSVKGALVDGGFFIALNPLVHYIYEGHIFLLWAHRFHSYVTLRKYIEVCSFLGLGKYPAHHRETGVSREVYSERHADYIFFWTDYASEYETLRMAKNAGLRASFSFTSEFYTLKLRQLLKLRFHNRYKWRRSNFSNSVMIKLFRYVSGVTLVCQKRNTY